MRRVYEQLKRDILDGAMAPDGPLVEASRPRRSKAAAQIGRQHMTQARDIRLAIWRTQQPVADTALT
jgi:DNA-binding GntR family transcriptional regulator